MEWKLGILKCLKILAVSTTAPLQYSTLQTTLNVCFYSKKNVTFPEDSMKWSLIINNDACLPFCGLFLIYNICTVYLQVAFALWRGVTGIFGLPGRDRVVSWNIVHSQQFKITFLTVRGGRVLANPAPLTLDPQLFYAIPNSSKIRWFQKM